jgi:hypothetical protein
MDPKNDYSKDKLPMQSEDGVDLTLIRWLLSLTPLERLQALQQWIEIVKAPQDASTGDKDSTVLPILVRAREG